MNTGAVLTTLGIDRTAVDEDVRAAAALTAADTCALITAVAVPERETPYFAALT